MKQYIYFATVVIILLSTIYFYYNKYQGEKAERIRQENNVETLLSDNKEYKIRDSLNVLQVAALTLNIDELKKYRSEDLQLINDLKLKKNRVEYITKTSILTKDSIVFKLQPSDSCFHYSDKWLRVDACLSDSSMIIESKDSIVQVINRIPKHKFLWFSWGTKGYKIDVVNFNPNSKISYSEFIRLQN
ncbi:MAG: hypothetical protein PHX49_06215 [Bacteroidales bacterium]|nr:hypothetical protein [Bacteroidales bacterium]